MLRSVEPTERDKHIRLNLEDNCVAAGLFEDHCQRWCCDEDSIVSVKILDRNERRRKLFDIVSAVSPIHSATVRC